MVQVTNLPLDISEYQELSELKVQVSGELLGLQHLFPQCMVVNGHCLPFGSFAAQHYSLKTISLLDS